MPVTFRYDLSKPFSATKDIRMKTFGAGDMGGRGDGVDVLVRETGKTYSQLYPVLHGSAYFVNNAR